MMKGCNSERGRPVLGKGRAEVAGEAWEVAH